MASSGKRTRGPNKQAPWSRSPDDGVSVIRLALDSGDPMQRRQLEEMFWTAYQVRRALQRKAQRSTRAYWAASKQRAIDPARVRERVGLSKRSFEYAAYRHLDAAPHLRRHTTKALVMHLADEVWASVERHLFRDASGRRHGAPHIGRFRDFTRLAGRAQSHTKANKWETFRLHGTLAGHRAAYADRDGRFVQPQRLGTVESKAWWQHTGPLAVVFSGLAGGTLVLPVRLPTAPSSQAHLAHHLADPSKWHKIDLVRRRCATAPGGWSYEAHLMVLVQPYASPATIARRATAAIAMADRSAGIDVNVSNITVASHERGRDVKLSRIDRDEATKQRDRGRARRERRRQRALDRSRRAMNRAQYQLSKRQAKRARRRAEAGLRAIEVVPAGPRKTHHGSSRPVQPFRRDQLSRNYRRLDAARAWDAASAVRTRTDRARLVAANLVATHGYQLITEDVRISSWSSSWGRAVAALSPGTLMAAIDREALAVGALAGGGGGVLRASTATTALSQHCPCGARVDKRLGDRVHHCTACGLRGDRDAVSAILGAFVELSDRTTPSSARVDYATSQGALRHIRDALESSYSGWQDTLSESTGLSARDGSFIAWRTPTPDNVVVARRTAGTATCSTRNEIGSCRTTSDRMRRRNGMPYYVRIRQPGLWDNS